MTTETDKKKTPKEEDEILRLTSAGATKAEREEGFRRLFTAYGEMLYWHIRRMVVGHDDAEDVMQETAIKIFAKVKTFEGKSSLKTWAYKIATNEALQYLRKQSGVFHSIDSATMGTRLVEEMLATEGVDPEAAETHLQAAVLRLPTQQRLVFNMRYYDDMTYEEIAAVTGKNVSTLKSSYHFATDKIRDYLKENAI